MLNFLVLTVSVKKYVILKVTIIDTLIDFDCWSDKLTIIILI